MFTNDLKYVIIYLREVKQMELFDRIIVKENFQMPGVKNIISQNIIGTIRQIINNTVIVQIDFIDESQKLISIPLNLIRNATIEDLEKVKTLTDCMKIINPIFHPGNEYITSNEIIYKIEGFKLALNELYDLFKIEGSETLITRKYLDTMSHIPYIEKNKEYDEILEILERDDSIKENKTLEFSTQDGPIEKNEDQFKIINNGFEFIIKDNNIDLGTIPLDKLEIYITTLIKLTKILNY